MDAPDLRTLWGPTIGNDAAWEGVSPGTTLRPPTLAGGTIDSEVTPSTVRSQATPAPVGRFEFISEIGRGGMGVVWRAHQGSLSREVAIKRLPGGDDLESQRRFIAEALVTGYLDHPNIVPVHDLCRDEHGEVLLAMKLVGGRSWNRLLHPNNEEDRLAASEFDFDRHLDILTAVCNAIAFAHARGIIHRDLKPENIMVGSFGEVLVMDWGIALDVSDDPSHATRAPHRSSIRSPAGTPSYLAPEQAQGLGSAISARTDIFLLGAVLYELIAKRPPHTGQSLLQVLMAAANPETPRFPRGTPLALQTICLTAMAKRPEDRFASVADFQRALNEYRRTQQSERATDAAQAALEQSIADAAKGGGDEGSRNRLYGGFADAVAGFGQALVLWEGNRRALLGQRNARLAWAKAALAHQDLGLAATQAAELAGDPEGKRLADTIDKARQQRDTSVRHTRLLRRGLVAAGVAIVIAFATGFILVSKEQGRTELALKQVTEEQQLTSAERDAKEAARVEADRQREMAATHAERAEQEAEKALTEAARAKAEEEKALAATKIAIHEAWRGRVELAKVMFERGMADADVNSTSTAAAYFLGALELAPENLVPDGYVPPPGQPAWADFAWRAFTLLHFDEQLGSGLSLDHFVADAAFLDNERVLLATGLSGYIRSIPGFKDEVRYEGRASAVAGAANGKRFAIAPVGHAIGIANPDGRFVMGVGSADQQIALLALSADGTRLAAVAWSEPHAAKDANKDAITFSEAGPQRLLLFDLNKPKIAPIECAIPGGRVSDLAWSQDNLTVLSPHQVFQLDAQGSTLAHRVIEGSPIALAPDGNALMRCIGAAGGTLAILEHPLTGQVMSQVLMRGIPNPVTTALSNQKRGAVFVDGMLHTVDFNTKAITWSSVLKAADVSRRARMSPDGKTVLVTCWARGGSTTVQYMKLDPPRFRQPRAVIGLRRDPFALIWGAPHEEPPAGTDLPLAVVPAIDGHGIMVHTRNPEGHWQCIHFNKQDEPQSSWLLAEHHSPMPWWRQHGDGLLWMELHGDGDHGAHLDNDVFRTDRVQQIYPDESLPATQEPGVIHSRRPTRRPFPICRRVLVKDTNKYTIVEMHYKRGEAGSIRDEVSSTSGLIRGGRHMLLQRGNQVMTVFPEALVLPELHIEYGGRLVVSPDGTRVAILDPPYRVTIWHVLPTGGIIERPTQVPGAFPGQDPREMLRPNPWPNQPRPGMIPGNDPWHNMLPGGVPRPGMIPGNDPWHNMLPGGIPRPGVFPGIQPGFDTPNPEGLVHNMVQQVTEHLWENFLLPDDDRYHYLTIQSVIMIGDGSRLLIGFRNGNLRCWDLLGGKVIWQTLNARCTSLAIDQSGLLIAGWDETIPGAILIDAGTGRRLATIRWPGSVSVGSPVLLAFTADNQRLRIAREHTCLEWVIRNTHAADSPPGMTDDGALSPAFEALYDEVQYRVLNTGPEAGMALPYHEKTKARWLEK